MRLLFEIDFKDYNPNWKIASRPSARAIIIKDNKVYMIHNKKYDFYEFPGGGIEEDESMKDALIRETKEEAGLIIKVDSIKEFGYVHRANKDIYDNEVTFVQDNYYYLCDVEDIMINQSLSEREKEDGFILELVDFNTVFNVNKNNDHGPVFSPLIIERDTKVLEMAIEFLNK
ncbi:NUDIX domain-containing protein [Anaeroplasma bactoclasticum]|jgi:8-oxo-dGTP pyrophosphatase MutT (NUDIX family)|uniref:NUDIX domain-containing protein n=1 Tax=Anaeroplasma bactoclasticum TaxID=2088 RepID=A0A397QW57_9MOLU|nr:NUDIX domain-containing protein [Anaeroplasma bactoclasticum]RIA65009.1 NUDIX domain-containing protein [Anaeroplasma bactoclasticum]